MTPWVSQFRLLPGQPNVSFCSWVSSYGACSFIGTRKKSWMGNSRWPVAPCSPNKGLMPRSSLRDEGTWAGAGSPISILLGPLFLLTGLGERLLEETNNSWLRDFSDFGRACQTLGISLPLSHQESMDLCLGF